MVVIGVNVSGVKLGFELGGIELETAFAVVVVAVAVVILMLLVSMLLLWSLVQFPLSPWLLRSLLWSMLMSRVAVEESMSYAQQ